MDHQFGGGGWMMVPTQSPMAQDHQSLHPQYHQQPPPAPAPPPQQLHQSLASHFHLLHLVESLAEAIESGTRDQQSDALVRTLSLSPPSPFRKVNELTNQFDKCQQLINSISGSISTKAMTVEGQKRKLEETAQQLNQRRDLIAKYRSSLEELVNSDSNR